MTSGEFLRIPVHTSILASTQKDVWAPSLTEAYSRIFPDTFLFLGVHSYICLVIKTHTTMSKKYEHGYLPKIQYHSLQVVERTNTIMEPNLPEEFKASELAALNKSLDSIIYFTAKLREQWKLD